MGSSYLCLCGYENSTQVYFPFDCAFQPVGCSGCFRPQGTVTHDGKDRETVRAVKRRARAAGRVLSWAQNTAAMTVEQAI